jgi:hypothetical protein
MSEQMHIPGLGAEWALHEARTHRCDGAVSIEGWWGGRAVNVALEEAGLPVLDFPVDPVDANKWDDKKSAAMISQFIEERVIPMAEKRRARV